MCSTKVIGYWISEKKRQKFNWLEFQNICKRDGFSLKIIDINSNVESQGPIHVFLHKLTDVLAHAESGDQAAKEIITKVQGYIRKHPELLVIDPLENVKNLYNRQLSYEIIRSELKFDEVFVPNSVEIQTSNEDQVLFLMKRNGIQFPCVCKPLFAHGSSDAHKMMIVFNEDGLKDCQTPYVAQNFINHNAILYKLFIVDGRFHVVERPSLKNFYQRDCASLKTIFFSSHDISKSGSNSKWSIISEDDLHLGVKPKNEYFQEISEQIVKIFGLILVGVDVVIENHTGKYAIIDVNVFPGYDGYPHFFEHLIESIKKRLKSRKVYSKQNFNTESSFKNSFSEDLDSGFESDEKKKQFSLS
ncbi:inositol-tetrakisphosphate 1-kinase-like isoform X1 [Leptopilina heterotoma]|uniref:inositol-tetrakisphosphate 1-kinase-like isoform X1 n=1 Tax=Leptopilina heterotoma TaxID=63436 RepID=UPI001CA9B76A|nr:inositol-tetrakisphosphate 1-kinase-like isoform X1 [Leptopilina heterotoma]